MYGLILFIIAVLLMLLEIPVGLSLFFTGTIGVLLTAGFKSWWYSLAFSVQPITTNSTYLVIPLFLLMGQIASKTTINFAIINVSRLLFGKMRAGSGIASIITAALFGAICGSSIATTASLGPISYKLMNQSKYSKELIFGTIAAGGTLGVLIPPSIVLIIYGIIVQESIMHLFLAAIIPSLIAVFGYIICILISIYKDNNIENNINHKNNNHDIYEESKKDLISKSFTLNKNEESEKDLISNNFMLNKNIINNNINEDTNKLQQDNIKSNKPNTFNQVSYKATFGIFAFFFFVLYCMYADFISPSTCASVIVTSMVLYKLFIDKCWDKKIWYEIFETTANSTGMIVLIFIGASIFNTALASAGFPRELSEFIIQYKEYPILIIFGIVLFFLILGCLMDGLALILLFAPLLHPIIISLDLGILQQHKGIWFGVLLLMLIEVALITPPVGMNLFVIKQSIKELRNVNQFKAIKYFVISDFIRILFLIFMPGIALFLIK